MTTETVDLAEWDAPLPDDDETRSTVHLDATTWTASWAMRRLAHARAALAHDEAVAAHEIDRIRAWLAERSARHGRDVTWLEDLLCAHAWAQRDAGGPGTVSTPWGSVTSTLRPAQVRVADKAEALAWASPRGLVRVTEAVDVAAAQRVLVARDGVVIDPSSGEVLPGFVVVAAKRGASFRLARDE